MTLDRPLRIALALAIVIGLLLLLLAIVLVSDSLLDLWDRLQTAPTWLSAIILLVVATLSLATGWALLRLLFWSPASSKTGEVIDEATLRARLEEAEAQGLDVDAARRELALLDSRRENGEFRVALFGEISTGKTAVIRALVPDGAIDDISVRGGSTRKLTDYAWVSPAGDRLIQTDVPGLNEAGRSLDQIASDEAMRAHAVIFVCDNDLTRDEFSALSALTQFDKPMIVALNKRDQFSEEQRAQLEASLATRLGELQSGHEITLVGISAAPREKIIRLLPSGREEQVFEEGPAEVAELRSALQQVMDRDPVLLEEMRDASVFVLARQKLDTVQDEHRQRRSQELVTSYTRKAIVGALAAVAPGTDILIQGYLGANFVRELCELYGVSPRDIDVQQFLKLSHRHIGKAMPLMLAIGGNALKAFPGAGTVAGGLMHAVAYGLIFDTLGKALSLSLRENGRLRPAPAASQFRKLLSENLEKRTLHVAKLALDASRERD
ncbi:MAG: GTPase domain-containing protein [Gammaproteobacteria bacterium]|nr:GTPase domain-containing protein [Gammaproteobacteria bacterium]